VTAQIVPLTGRWYLRPWREADAPSPAQHAGNVSIWRHRRLK
jgi:hypothetical protein